MAKEKTVYLTGEVMWPKVFKENPDVYQGIIRYTMLICPDAASEIALKTSGDPLKWRTIKDKEGLWVKLTREHEKEFRRKDKDGKINLHTEVFGPPKVVTKDEEGNYVPFDEAIGNGSVVTARVTVFVTANGRTGCRLEGLCVDKHVPYEGGKEEEELPF